MAMNDNRSVQRCLSLLRSFRGAPRKSLTDLSKAVNLPHSTVLRFLTTLENEGYVRREGALWSLTPQLLEIGFAALENAGITEFIQVSLQTLADSCAGTINIGEKAKDQVVIIARAASAIERRKLIIVNLRVGNSLPADSALYSALGMELHEWAIAHYDDRKTITVAIPLFNGASRQLSLGLSVDMDDYPMKRIEAELIPLMRKERQQIQRLMHLGEI
jgi:IclR family pca regulon transcriptional regulator